MPSSRRRFVDQLQQGERKSDLWYSSLIDVEIKCLCFYLCYNYPNLLLILRNTMVCDFSFMCYIAILTLYDIMNLNIFFPLNYSLEKHVHKLCVLCFSDITRNTDINRWDIILNFTILNKRHEIVTKF